MTELNNELTLSLTQADCLFSPEQVQAAIARMAQAISLDLAQSNPLVFSVMNGGLVLTGHLVTQLGFPLEISYLHATRYRDKTYGTELEWKTYPQQSIAGRTVLIVDDIHDEGHTLAAIVEHCHSLAVADVKVAVLIEKTHDRKAKPHWQPDYIGLHCQDRYVFGFGMDYKGYWRNAPGIYAVKEAASKG